MINNPTIKRKSGEVLIDLGKYVFTAVPIALFVSSYNEFSWGIFFYIAIGGLSLFLVGLWLIYSAEKMDEMQRKRYGKGHTMKLMRNNVLRIEQLN